MDKNHRFVSVGGVAENLGVSTTMVLRYERDGLIPHGERIGGSRARIWPVEQVAAMKSAIAERRATRTKETVAASAA